MAVQVSIPLVTVNAGGSRSAGPRDVPTLSQATFTIDRTAGTAPLNTRTQDADVLTMVIEFSKDGGLTWPDSNKQTLAGGTFTGHDGNVKTTDVFSMQIDPDVDSVQARVDAIQRVSFSGTIDVT